jgi:di/tricarboxylate transporter
MEIMQYQVSWLQWLAITLPVGALSMLACWLMLLYVYRPHHTTPLVQPIRASNEPLNRRQYFIIAVTVLTIIMWCMESQIRSVFGHSGIIGILPMIVFFGTGILDKDDFNSFLWTVAMLAMGGMSLGFVVKRTQLLNSMTAIIQTMIVGQSLWVIMFGFCTLLLVVATFISHTVSALIVLPLVYEVGVRVGQPLLLVMGSAIMCSGAMGLPVSGFPNIFAVSCEDATGENYVRAKDFLKVGVPLSIIVNMITVTVGYGIMLAIF